MLLETLKIRMGKSKATTSYINIKMGIWQTIKIAIIG
jgi:hypothetical protein